MTFRHILIAMIVFCAVFYIRATELILIIALLSVPCFILILIFIRVLNTFIALKLYTQGFKILIGIKKKAEI